MRPVPIPDHVVGVRMVIGEPGMSPADDGAPAPCEYLLTQSSLYPRRAVYHALVLLEEGDLEAIARGSRHVWLALDGTEVPWSLVMAEVVPDEL